MHEQKRILRKVGNKTALRVVQKAQLYDCLQQIQVQYPLISTRTMNHWDPASSDFAQHPQAPNGDTIKAGITIPKGKKLGKDS